jgi:hypothetical protein
MRKKRKLQGRVKKVFKPVGPNEPEKAQITIPEADELYRDLRIENALKDKNGNTVRLKSDAEVDVIIEADSNATTKKP